MKGQFKTYIVYGCWIWQTRDGLLYNFTGNEKKITYVIQNASFFRINECNGQMHRYTMIVKFSVTCIGD